MKNIASASEANRCKELIKQLMAIVDEQIPLVEWPALCSGLSGQLLFLIEAENAFPDTLDIEKIQNNLAKIQSGYNYLASPMRLDIGSVGVAWMLEFIQQKYGDLDEDINEQVDRLFYKCLEVEHWKGEVELLAGLAGIAMYAAKRYRFASGKALANKLVEHFKSLAEETDKGLAWPTKTTSAYHSGNSEEDEFNLGLAHGNPSITGALLKLYIASGDSEIGRMLESSCNWLIAQKNPPGCGSYFSYRTKQPSRSRIGWCYGDISNALTLWRAGKSLDSPRIMDVARQIAIDAASRRDLANALTFDAGVCHGTAGNMLIFQALYDEMGDQILLECAQFWLRTTLEFVDSSDGLAGLYRWDPIKEQKLEEFGLLEGYSGIGLCLMSAIGHDSQWKEHLLLD